MNAARWLSHWRVLVFALLLSVAAAIPNARSSPPFSVSLLANAAVTGPVVQWPGGVGAFTAVGTFSGATVTLQYLGPDNTTWVAAGTNTTLTASGNGVAYLPAGGIRAAVSGGSPSGLYANIGLVQ
jgi:hypothetical protein